ncbi:hypothetical protein PENTCL1PPCAC_12555, partial [Pristionchus entomophagus]
KGGEFAHSFTCPLALPTGALLFVLRDEVLGREDGLHDHPPDHPHVQGARRHRTLQSGSAHRGHALPLRLARHGSRDDGAGQGRGGADAPVAQEHRRGTQGRRCRIRKRGEDDGADGVDGRLRHDQRHLQGVLPREAARPHRLSGVDAAQAGAGGDRDDRRRRQDRGRPLALPLRSKINDRSQTPRRPSPAISRAGPRPMNNNYFNLPVSPSPLCI